MQLNLGCGFDRREDYVNVDSWPECQPDLLVDLECFPWPFETSSVTRILARHVLEHLGGDPQSFGRLWQELYRIAAPGCVLEVHVPYYKSADFWSDPTHVRVYTPLTFKMFSRAENQRWIDQRSGNTKLAMMLNIDFEPLTSGVIWESPWQERLDQGQITLDQLLEIERNSWNVVKELRFELIARKGVLC
jgi:hypothetical protein